MLLAIQGLRVNINGNPILHNVQLSVDRGQIFGLIGPNGAGKSTTIGAALGLIPVDGGEIRVLGKAPGDSGSTRAKLGVLPEQNGFYNWMTGPAYLSFYSKLYGRRLDKPAIEAKIAEVGLVPRPSQLIGSYSRGMRQCLGLARALIGDPELLILDEPTNGLDPRGRRKIHDILQNLARQGKGILLCTQLLDDVERLCHQVGVIVDGRTVASGAIADLVRPAGNHARFRLRLAGNLPKGENGEGTVSILAHDGEWWIVDLVDACHPDQTWRELLFRGWPISEIKREGGGLEDLYLSLTERKAA